ncbi:MAG: SRPBCC family protein [Actinobacteria bacterium]|nr:SRPBCC family protein [Actinomycetota bacterium]
MPKIEKSITIDGPVKKLFEYVSNAELMPEWLPGMAEVKDIKLTKEGVGSTYKLVYKMGGIAS